MRTIQVALVSVVLVMVFASVSAFAADCCAAKAGTCPAAAAKDAKGCPVKDAAAGPAEMSGKVEAKTEKGADGKEVTSYYLSVSDAKCAAGKECPLKGKTIKLTGPKAAEAEKLAGKQVDVKGTCGSGCADFDVASVTEKK